MSAPKISFIGFLSKKDDVRMFHMYLWAMRVFIGTRPKVDTQSEMKKLVLNINLEEEEEEEKVEE